MNERINDIAKRAGINFAGHSGCPLLVYPSELEKFVELFTAECIDVMVKHDYHGEWLGVKIKEHFSIK